MDNLFDFTTGPVPIKEFDEKIESELKASSSKLTSFVKSQLNSQFKKKNDKFEISSDRLSKWFDARLKIHRDQNKEEAKSKIENEFRKSVEEGKIALKENFESYLIPTEENEIRSKISHLLLSQFDKNLEKLKNLDPTVFEKTEKSMKDQYVSFNSSIFMSIL